MKGKVTNASWNINQFNEKLYLPRQPYSFTDFSTLFHTSDHLPDFSRPGKFQLEIPRLSKLFQDPYGPC